ncbi:MAG: hypothetical protein ACREX8_00775 [Gammaproteobacteria bacterium]
MPAGKRVDVGGIAQAVLDGIVAHFAAAQVTLPAYRTISPGETRGVAWDCEDGQLIVTCPVIGWGSAPGRGGPRQTGNPLGSTAVRHTVIGVQLVRCVTDPDGPAPAGEVTAAGLALLADMGLMSQALVDLCDRGGPLASHGEALPGDVAPVGPEGGKVAVEGMLTVTVGGLV